MQHRLCLLVGVIWLHRAVLIRCVPIHKQHAVLSHTQWELSQVLVNRLLRMLLLVIDSTPVNADCQSCIASQS